MIELSVVNETGSALSAASPTVIKIIGCGGGGSNAVNRMIGTGVENVEFIVLNTDLQALNVSKADKRIAIGQKITGGLGAGGNPQVGENAAKEDAELIKNVVNGADMVIITAGMGGGTGTGSAPVVAQIAKESGALTIAVVTTPFEFEASARMKYAEEGIAKLREQVDSLIVIPNEKIMKIAEAEKELSFTEAFRLADEVLCQGVQGISDIITKPGVVNTDFADVKSVMKDQGDAILGVGRASGENKIINAAQQAINNPMLENCPIDGARKILVNITSSGDLPMSEVRNAINFISETASPDRQVFWGQVIDPDMGDEISVTVIATGFKKDDSDTSFEVKEKNPAEDNIMTYDSFQNVMSGKTPVIPADSLNSPETISSTTTANPGLFDDNFNKNIAVPHENAPVDEDGKREGNILSSYVDSMKHSTGIQFPSGYKVDVSDITQPAVFRQGKTLSRGIDLTEEK